MQSLTRLTVKIGRVMFGLLLFGLGNFCTIQANIGLAPWVAFSMGVSQVSGISYGNAAALTGVGILVLDILLGEKIGIGTILNTLLVGKFVDLFRWLGLLPLMTSLPAGLVLLLVGQLINSIGSYYYMSGELGCGPRDSLMVALDRKLPRVPVGAVRSSIEAAALLVGFLLGAKIGAGTVISVFGMGFFIQNTFRLFHFNPVAVRHESVADSLRALGQKREPS